MRQLLLLAILLVFMAGIVAWKAFSEAPRPIPECESSQASYIVGPE